jgi:hypothetical protein
VLGAVLVVACDQDPARSVNIANASASANSQTSTPAPTLEWRTAMCEPSAEPLGPSSVVGTGACAFEQRGGAKCTLTDDDLLMSVTRPTPNDGLFMMFVTVENFQRGPVLNDVQVVVGMENARGLFRWTSDEGHVTVGPDKKFVTFDETRLTPVPPLEAQDVVVSGTFTCASTVHGEDAGR